VRDRRSDIGDVPRDGLMVVGVLGAADGEERRVFDPEYAGAEDAAARFGHVDGC
jgi:hypothetical protein